MRLSPTYPCPWRAGGGERAGARPGSPEGRASRAKANAGLSRADRKLARGRPAAHPRANLPPMLPPTCVGPAPGKADRGDDNGSAASRRACLARGRQRQCRRQSPRPRCWRSRVAASFCPSSGLPISWAGARLWASCGGQAVGQSALGQARLPRTGQAGATSRCFSHRARLPKRQTRAMATRARGRDGLRDGRPQPAPNSIGRRQQGSLFPAPLHSTVRATTKNGIRQRRK
jgi:hypothetical protein